MSYKKIILIDPPFFLHFLLSILLFLFLDETVEGLQFTYKNFLWNFSFQAIIQSSYNS